MDIDKIPWVLEKSTEDQVIKVNFEHYKELILLGFLPIGLSLESADTKRKVKTVAKKEDD